MQGLSPARPAEAVFDTDNAAADAARVLTLEANLQLCQAD